MEQRRRGAPKKATTKVQISLYVDPELLEAAEQVAEAEEREFPAAMRLIIRDGIRARLGTPPKDGDRRRIRRPDEKDRRRRRNLLIAQEQSHQPTEARSDRRRKMKDGGDEANLRRIIYALETQDAPNALAAHAAPQTPHAGV